MAKKNSAVKLILSIFTILILISGGYIFLSPQFEKAPPEISLENNTYWNLKDKLIFNLKDSSGIKYYKIVFKVGENEKILESKILEKPQEELSIEIKAPAMDIFFKSNDIQIVVTAVDNSKWNFLNGNENITTFDLTIDATRPTATVVANTLAINRGGSAIAVVNVEDENLESAYITFNNEEHIFSLTPYYKEGYYVSLIAWDVNIKDFEQVTLVATDKAGNITKTKIPLYIRPLKVKNDDIKISENFIKNTSVPVLEQSSKQIPDELIDIFLLTNKDLREENVEKLKEHSRKYMDRSAITNYDIKPFRRLIGAKTVASFADRRHYYFNDEKIDEAWHLGMDWASVKQAPIKVTNPGRVIANEYIGIYGNTIIVDHKMGLSTLYSHLSNSKVNVGDELYEGQLIGNTGSTGAVFGDHLHFGVLVQGVEVNPLEWMDRNWIKTRITDILDKAKKKIDNK